jgi:CDP-paratose 2-epimerase
MKKILITGGCGFVGSNLVLSIKKKFPKYKLIVVDNFHRKGSLVNKKRLLDQNIKVIKCDIRYKKNFTKIPKFDLLIDCAADPSVLSGLTNGLNYLIETNINGTLNCLEACKRNKAGIIFISTSRVYPFEKINSLKFIKKNNEFKPSNNNKIDGFSDSEGISENFGTEGLKTFYGFTKLSAENLIKEYCSAFNINYIINRAGVIAGPWQWGRVDQGFMVHWLISHYKKNKLNYIGYKGTGCQIRDILNVRDFCEIIFIQIENFKSLRNNIFNIGGGKKHKISLINLNKVCEEIYKNKLIINKVKEDRYGDIPYYVTNNSKINKQTGWQPSITTEETIYDIFNWINDNINLISKNL